MDSDTVSRLYISTPHAGVGHDNFDAVEGRLVPLVRGRCDVISGLRSNLARFKPGQGTG